MFVSAAALVGVLTLSGCSGTPESTPATDATANVVQSEATPSEAQSAQDGPSEADIKTYFEKLATGDPKIAAEAAELAAPDSNAFAYATYLGASIQAGRDGGFPSEKSTVKKIDDGFSMCPAVVTAENPCSEFTDIQHVDGRIADFNAGGEPLSGRISLGNGESQPLGDLGNATLVASYKSIAGAVVVVFDVTSESDGLSFSASYIAPDGRQSQTTMMGGPIQLAIGAFGTYAFFFEGAEYGGSVSLKPYSSSSFDTPSVTFATR